MKKKPDESDDELMFRFDDLNLRKFDPYNKPKFGKPNRLIRTDDGWVAAFVPEPVGLDPGDRGDEKAKEVARILAAEEKIRKLKIQQAIAKFINDPDYYDKFGFGYRNKKTKRSKKTKRYKKTKRSKKTKHSKKTKRSKKI